MRVNLEPIRRSDLRRLLNSARRRGIGLQMVRQILKVGFDNQRLHRIELVVFTFNEAAVSCYEKAGFQTEGVMRQIVRVGGEYWHWKMMSILEEEYTRISS